MDEPFPSIPANSKPNTGPSDPDFQETGIPAEPRDVSPLATMPAEATPCNPNLSSASLAALAQRYDILGEAGRGAMGQVYKARDRETGDIVALKLLKPEIASDQAMVERFKSELLFARKITHKNVCRVYEFNRAGGIAYTSMEFVEGESLRSVLNRFGSLAPRKATDLALQMCSGLKEAHAQGIVHRDLKPENVMIDTQGDLKIMDFGIARSMESMSRLTGAMTGTPAYMAPEQVTGKPVDYRTDIYALGLMLYEMFTGTQPFRGDNAIAVALQHVQESPRRPREIEASVPAAVEAAILKCLEKEPANRFQSVAELEGRLRSQGVSAATNREPAVEAQLAADKDAAGATAAQSSPQPSSLQPSSKNAFVKSAFFILTLVGLGAAAAGAFWAWRGMGKRAAEKTSAPVSSPAVSTPVFTPTMAELPVVTKPQVKTTPAQPKPKKSESDMTSQPPALPKTPTAPSPAPAADQPPSEEALSGVPPDSAIKDSEPPATPKHPVYILVGRFQREAVAQDAAKSIEDLGLPVSVVPRHNPVNHNEFFAVFSGPFGPGKIDNAKELLQSKGFKNLREVKGLGVQAANASVPSP